MKQAWKWYNCLSNRIRTSITISAATDGLISTIMSVVGASLYDWTQNIWIGLIIFVGAFFIIEIATYLIIGQVIKDSERLDMSKNIVLFLSSETKNSIALKEEIDYGINTKGLPVIVIYPDFKEKSDIWCSAGMRKQVKDLWDKLPKFRDSMGKVATLHVPYKKSLITSALSDLDFRVQTMTNAGQYHYKVD